MNQIVADLLAYQTRLWNALIPTRALRVDRTPGGVRYLQPTKGWRFVSNRRLGLA